jgi:hypothetical protein
MGQYPLVVELLTAIMETTYEPPNCSVDIIIRKKCSIRMRLSLLFNGLTILVASNEHLSLFG